MSSDGTIVLPKKVPATIDSAPENTTRVLVSDDGNLATVDEDGTIRVYTPGTNDHGALTGLGDDDHTQYLTNGRGDVRYYTKAETDTFVNAKLDSSDPRLYSTNIINVKQVPGPGEFSSIAAAIASISGSDSANRYVIKLGVGIFNESNPLVVPPYVSVEGESIQTSIVKPIYANQHLFVLSQGVELSFMSLYGITGSIGSVKAAIYSQDVGDFAQLHKLSIYDFDIGISNVATTADSTLYAEYVDINGNYSYGYKNLGENGFTAFAQAENFYTYPGDGTVTQIGVKSEGPLSELFLHTVGLIGGTNTSGVVVNDGGYSAISGTFIINHSGSAIRADNYGAAPTIEVNGTSFEGNTVNLDIQHPDADGNFTGFCKYLKINIAPTAPFFITNKDSKIIRVAKKGGDFTSVKDAIDSITGQSVTNPYVVSIGPGIFLENQITGKEYVTLLGQNTTIAAADPSNPLIIGVDAFSMNRINLSGVTDSGIPTIYYESSGNEIGAPFSISDLVFGDSDTLVHIKGSTYPTSMIIDGVQFGGENTFINGFICEDAGAGFTQLAITSLLAQRNSSPYPTTMFKVFGAGAELDLFSAGARNDTPSGTFLEAYNAANVRVTGALLSGWDKVIYVPNIGSAPEIRFGNSESDDTGTYDVQILHPGTTGSLTGSYDSTKTYIDDSSPIAVNISDAVNGGNVIVGALRLGSKNSNATDVTDLIQLSSPSGLITGGVISASTNPLDVSVSSGFGYVSDSVTETSKKIMWNTAVITLADNTNNYVYVNNSGTVTSSNSLPTVTQTILLGRIRTSGGAITFKAIIPYIAKNAATHLDEFLRTALGSIYVAGSVVSENLSTPRKIDVTSGQYWFSRLKFSPAGGSTITYKDFYHSSGSFVEGSGSTVDNTQYDNLTNLTSLTAGYYVKHSLYIAGDGANETYALIRGQAQYSTLLAAQQASLPNVPSFFSDISTPIAALIMQEGTNSIVNIIDIHPKVGFQSPSTSASADHGSLLGLGDDDHTQYLRTDGTRALTGDQSFGTHNITNVGTVNGVTVQTHASRHAFNGADPLLSAVPQTIGTANAEGVDNTHVARADHVHSHGSLAGGTTHAAVTTSVNGFMSAADKVKLDGIATAATAYSDEQAQDAVGNILVDSASVDFTYNDIANTITAAVLPAGVDHNSLANYVANKHVDHSTVSITAGTGLSGGGDITASRTLNLANTTVTAGSYGSSTAVSTFTVDAQGRLTAASNTAIASATPSTLNATNSNTQGTASSFALSDHLHAISTGAPSTQTPDQTNTTGSSASLARADHIHNIATAAASSISTSTANTQGSSTSFSRADHTHDVSIINSRVSSSTLITTTSTSDVVMTGMTITPQAGTYHVTARAIMSATSNVRLVTMSIYSGGVKDTTSEVTAFIRTGGTFLSTADASSLFCDAVVTVNGAQAVELRWRTSGGTAQTQPYAINLMRIS